jgi:diguanylate cyclase (GGDEF)-like protein
LTQDTTTELRGLYSPDSLQLLQQGARRLSFPGDMEREYRNHHLQQSWGRVAVALILVFLLNVALVRLNLAGPPADMPDVFIHARNWLLQPLLVVLLAVGLWRPFYLRWWLIIGPVIFAMGGIMATPSEASKVAAGNHHAFLSILTGLFQVYALTAFLFFRTLMVSLSISGTYICFLLGTDVAPDVLYYETIQLLVVNLIGVVFCYTLEHTSRNEFLRTRQLQLLSTRDPLTRLANRRSFSQHLDRLWSQGLRDRQPVGLMLIDVDCFKDFNDRYGHQAGDECLVRVAKVIARLERRPLDMAARVGGEEFAVLMYGASQEYLESLAKQVHEDVIQASIPHDASTAARHVTVSVGTIYAVPEAQRTPAGLYQFADQMLYEAKRRGRNRVQIGNPDNYAAMQTGRFDHAPLPA